MERRPLRQHELSASPVKGAVAKNNRRLRRTAGEPTDRELHHQLPSPAMAVKKLKQGTCEKYWSLISGETDIRRTRAWCLRLLSSSLR